MTIVLHAISVAVRDLTINREAARNGDFPPDWAHIIEATCSS